MRKLFYPSLLTVLAFLFSASIVSAQASKCGDTDYNCQVTEYTKAIQSNPNDIENYYSRGRAYRELNKFDAAIADLTKYISMAPSSAEYLADGYIARANTYFAAKQNAKAIADFGKAIEAFPSHAEAYYNRARVYYSEKSYNKAISDLDKYISMNTSKKDWLADGYENRAMSYEALGNNAQALKDYSAAIDSDPSVAHRFTNRASLYRKMGKTALADQDEKKAGELKDQ